MQGVNYKLNKGKQTTERHSNYKAVAFYVRDARARRARKQRTRRICARRARAAHEIMRGGVNMCATRARLEAGKKRASGPRLAHHKKTVQGKSNIILARWPKHLNDKEPGIYKLRITKKGKLFEVREVQCLF